MTSAILCAAGSGTRTGFSVNKILAPYHSLPLLCYSLSAFSECDEMIVVCREEDENAVQKLTAPLKNARLVRGGATRFESVYHGLQACKGDIVLIHDAARPFVTKKIIERCIASANDFSSGIAAIPAVDTLALSQDGKGINSYLARAQAYHIQTPQAFRKSEIIKAYGLAIAEGKQAQFTDDSGIYNNYIGTPFLVEGDRANKKLTFEEDFASPYRVGFGVDTHRFETPEDTGLPLVGFITLGGVHVPSDKRLVAHSDGDVLVHALMDALLSAAGKRDIGFYFPPSDEKYCNADSMQLLGEVMQTVRGEGLTVQNVSISVLAERPRLFAYIDSMRETLSAALSVDKNAVAIAAGTNETLGYIGEGKGITCYAYVSLTQDKKQG